MSRNIVLIGLIAVSLMAFVVDCYAGYALFLMTAMPIGHYLSPFLLLFLVISVPITFVASIIGLFRFRKWGYWIFFITTLLLHSFLIREDIYLLSIKAIKTFKTEQIMPIVSLFVSIIYFMLPYTRRLFKRFK